MSDSRAASPAEDAPLVSVLIPAKNETGNIGALAAEIDAALRPVCAFEIVLVDDGSDDATGEEFLQRCGALGAAAQLIRHERSVGQSTALMTAARHARQILENTTRVLAIELYSAARAIDLRLRDLTDTRLGSGTASIFRKLRDKVPYQAGDAWWGPEIQCVHAMIENREFGALIQAAPVSAEG